MKTASGIIALILGILTVLNVGGCVKAEHDYSQFEAYQNSGAGFVEGLARGFQSGSQGDLFGANLNLIDQTRGLHEAVQSARMSAWLCLIGTGIALTVSCLSVAPGVKPNDVIKRTNRPPMNFDGAPKSVAHQEQAATVEERLRTLEQLKAAELISAGEYEPSMRRILDAI